MIAEAFNPASIGYAQMMGPRSRPAAVAIRTATADFAEACVELAKRAGGVPLDVADYRRMLGSACVSACTLSLSTGGPHRLAGFAMARWSDRWVEHYLLALDVPAGRARRFALDRWAARLVRFAEGREIFADVPSSDRDAVAALAEAGFRRLVESWGVHHGPTKLSRMHRPAVEGSTE